MKKGIFKIVCAVSLIAVTASVSAEWRFAGYDTTNPPTYGKIYNEVINGKYTSKHKTDPVDPKDVEWKFESYERDYPHAGYERLYLEGNAQKAITRTTNLFPQWETRFRDFMWELCGTHRIYQRQQTKIYNKTWRWDFGRDAAEDALVFVPTTRDADVTVDYRNYGFANLDNDGYYVFDVNGVVYNPEKYTLYHDFDVMPKAFDVKLDAYGNPTKEIKETDYLHWSNLSKLDATNQYEIADWDIAEYIDNMKSKFVTGPSYAGESKTKDAAAFYWANIDIAYKWQWDTADNNYDGAIMRKYHDAAISWTKPQYELAEPYKYFQYLIVNGVIMDGHNDTPRIYRFTGGKASPKVEWRYAFAEADWPNGMESAWPNDPTAVENIAPYHHIVEFKYVMGNDNKWVKTDEYRYPTGEYGRTYIKVTDKEVQIWLKDDHGKDQMLDSRDRAGFDFGDWYAGYVGGAVYVVE